MNNKYLLERSTVSAMIARLLAPLIIGLTLFPVAKAETFVSGEVTGVWSLDRSPYTITGRVTVPDSGELVIEPGVEIRSLHGNGLTVYGRLIAEGAESDTIHFSPAGWVISWDGLRFFEADSGTRLNYCLIRNGERRGRDIGDTTLSGGNALIIGGNLIIEHTVFLDGEAAISGGGLAIYRSSPTINECLFAGNSAFVGGAISCLDSSSPILENCTFISNRAEWGGGGGFFTTGSSPRLNSCIFEANETISTAEGGLGGGLYIYNNSDPLIQNCRFSENMACQGGAMYISGQSCAARIFWTEFVHNSARDFRQRGGAIAGVNSSELWMGYCRFISNEAAQGGALYVYDPSRCRLNNLMFSQNVANNAGGACYSVGGQGEETLTLTRCTFEYNRQTSENQAAPNAIWSPSTILSSSILSGESPYFNGDGTQNVHHCDIRGGAEGEANRDIIHDFYNQDMNWCLLSGDSPAIDTGDESLPEDPDGSRADRGWLPFPHNAWDNLELDSLSFSMLAGETQSIRIRWRNQTGVPFVATPMDAINFRVENMVDVSALTGDNRLQAAIRSDGSFYLAGAGAQNDPTIYRLNEEMELTGSFRQPGNPRGEGFYDLGGDGELILVGGDIERISEFSTDGESGESYVRPEGVLSCKAIAADYRFAEGFSEFYVGDSTGTVVRCGPDFRTIESYQTGMNISALAMRRNSRSLYLAGEKNGRHILAHLNPQTGTVFTLKELELPEGYVPGGAEISSGIDPQNDQFVGLFKDRAGQGQPDVLYYGDLYTVWIGIVAEPVLLMPGKMAEWEVAISGDYCPPGDYEGEYLMAVNGYGAGGRRAIALHLSPNGVKDQVVAPASLTISAFPNPFNGQLTIRYSVDKPGFVSVVLLDLSGRQLVRLDQGYRPTGSYAMNADLSQIPSGKYFASVSQGEMMRVIPINCVR